MERYQGDGLKENSKIAVIANDAIGNFVIATPLLQLLKSELRPKEIHYFGGTRTLEFQGASNLFDLHYPLHGSGLFNSFQVSSSLRPYDLIVNIEQGDLAKAFAGILASDKTLMCGPCLTDRDDLPFPEDAVGDLWRDKEWVAEDITERYPFLTTGWIGEIFCRLAYLKGAIPAYKVPTKPTYLAIPEVLIATSASLPEKLWPTDKWMETLAALKDDGLTIGLVGAKPSKTSSWLGYSTEDELVAQPWVRDLRGKMTLPEVADALSKAKLVLTLDNGIMHLAAAVSVTTVALFRHGIHRLWAPPSDQIRVVTPGEGKSVSDISVESVLEACRR